MKKHVGLDFDDVLMACNEQLLTFHNANYGTNYEKHHITSYQLAPLWGCTPQESYNRVREFYESKEHKDMKPLEGAIEAIHNLAEKYDLTIVTARPPEVQEITRALLLHFPKVFKTIHFVGSLTGNTPPKTKAEVCKEEHIDLFVEDNITNAINISLLGIPSLLLDQPWNQEQTLPDNVIRVYSWTEIVEKIDNIFLVD